MTFAYSLVIDLNQIWEKKEKKRLDIWKKEEKRIRPKTYTKKIQFENIESAEQFLYLGSFVLPTLAPNWMLVDGLRTLSSPSLHTSS